MTPPIQPFPPRPGPPGSPTTKVPRVFSIWGTIAYGVTAITSLAMMFAVSVTTWKPPWWYLGFIFLYVFISTGIICNGRIEANKDAKLYIKALRKRSAENMRKMN